MDNGNTSAPAETAGAAPSAPLGDDAPTDALFDHAFATLGDELREDDEEQGNAADEADEVEAASETDEAEQEAEEEPSEKPATVKLQDGTEVTLDELRRGYLRQSDYTRKTQDLAREREYVSQVRASLSEADQGLKSYLDLAIGVIRDSIPQPPSPDLIDIDIREYEKQKLAYESKVAKLQQLVTARKEVDQRQSSTTREQEQAIIQNEFQQVVQKFPDFADPAKRTAFLNDAASVSAKNWGYTPEEIASIKDHRAVLVLKDALAYRKLQSQRMTAVAKAKQAPPMRAATRAPAGAREEKTRREALNRARQTGSIEDVMRTLDPSDIPI